jgi:hypothetical protein
VEEEGGGDHLTVENALADAHHLLTAGQDGLHVLKDNGINWVKNVNLQLCKLRRARVTSSKGAAVFLIRIRNRLAHGSGSRRSKNSFKKIKNEVKREGI